MGVLQREPGSWKKGMFFGGSRVNGREDIFSEGAEFEMEYIHIIAPGFGESRRVQMIEQGPKKGLGLRLCRTYGSE